MARSVSEGDTIIHEQGYLLVRRERSEHLSQFVTESIFELRSCSHPGSVGILCLPPTSSGSLNPFSDASTWCLEPSVGLVLLKSFHMELPPLPVRLHPHHLGLALCKNQIWARANQRERKLMMKATTNIPGVIRRYTKRKRGSLAHLCNLKCRPAWP